MDPRHARSRTSSTSSMRSPHGSGPHPATPLHTPNTLNSVRSGGQQLSAASSFNAAANFFHNVSPDQLAAGLYRVRAEQQGGSRSSPPTPAPTPNPLVQVNYPMVPEQLVAGIKKIRVDEGYIDSTSFPATPAPSPFSPSPAHFMVFSPDQVAERLREESSGATALFFSGASSAQPPTPSTTPGLGSAPPPLINANLGIIPELLQESIDNLKGTDEGLASTSNPATPIQTPHSPSLSQQFESGRGHQVVLPEQLAAGIHRLKVEEGMSSGGSSGFPSTPAPTPFSAHPGGVQPEELAAGISRLSVIEESGELGKNMASSNEPNLSQYFGNQESEFFDTFNTDNEAVMQSCRESGVDLPNLPAEHSKVKEAEISVSEQAEDDEKSLKQRKQSQDNNQTVGLAAFDNRERPTTLSAAPLLTNTLATPTTTPSTVTSSYATPVAPTPVNPIFSTEGLAYSTYAASPNMTNMATPMQFSSNVPITSPLPMTSTPLEKTSQASNVPVIVEDEDAGLSDEEIRLRHLWPQSEAVRTGLTDRSVDRGMLTSAVVQAREELRDPVKSMVLHYKGEAEAAKRNVLTVNDVSQDVNGLNQLIRVGCLRSAINLTSRLLLRPPLSTQHSPTSLSIWHVRLALLLKLKQFNTVESEASAFGDLDKIDLFFEFYPEQYGGRRGSMVPFGLRVLIAELPLHLGKPLDAMDRLYGLLAIVDKILLEDADGSELWTERKIRVLYALANCGIQQKDFEMASAILDQIHDLEKSAITKAHVRSIQGRVFLQLGDLLTAMKFFEQASSLRPDPDVDSLIDKSCLSIASNNYIEAYEFLAKANEMRPHNPVVINNMSVCLLYLGRLKEALNLLESNLTANPEAFLLDTQVLNLATLYELESSYAGQKKHSLLDLMSRHAGDGVNTACLKF